MNRRHLIALGAVAAAVSVGLRVWRERAPAPSAASADASILWQASFPQPDGQALVMAGLRGTPLVLNFWATWCPPCVREMPELDRFARQFVDQGVHVVGLAIDNPAAVREFLARTPVSYTIGMAGFDGTDLSRKLGNDAGALPFTAVFDRSGRLVQRKLGQTSFDELSRWVRAL